MSIFKESFKDSVKKQIERRQNQIGSPNRNHFLQRQCTIRMASGVDITPEYFIQDSSFEAKNYILEGGTKPLNSSLRSGFRGAYDSPSDGFGNVPMPGITDVNIKTLTAYGSLRGATVNFECHSREQLDILELLYMRPGYPCLLEWGWLPYLANEGNTQNNMVFISDNEKFFKSGEYDQNTLQESIISKKEEYDSNYDGLYGIVKNFNISVRKDGGFSCTTELIAMGEVLDSLKGNLSSDNPVKHSLEEFLETINEYSSKSSKVDAKNRTTTAGDSRRRRERVGERRKEEADKAFAKIEKLGLEKNKDFILHTSDLEKDPKPGLYLKWGALIKVLNQIVIPNDNNSQPIIEFIHEDLNFNTFEIPEDLNIKLKGDITDKYGIEFFNTSTFNKNLSLSINPQICLFPYQIFDIFGIEPESGYNKIENIYFETDYLLKTFTSQYRKKTEFDDNAVNEDFSLGKYIKVIWDGVNNSSANVNNFQINNDFQKTHVIKVIDLEFDKNNTNLSKDKILKLNVLNPKSIVRDFNFSLSIPNSLVSTIAVMSQNPDDAENLNDVTFAAFNKGVNNRFFTGTKSPDQVFQGPSPEPKGSKLLSKLTKLTTELQLYINRLLPLQGNKEPITVQNAKTLQETEKTQLAGDSYTDYDEIPSGDISKARAALKQIKTLVIDLQRYNYNDISFPLKPTSTPPTTSIIPLKFNCKLDGISDIIIGNVFKIDGTRLPKGYDKNNIAFIVMGEDQQINGQDWTTTITGQAILLPI